MKKIKIIIVAALFGLVAMTSCKKESGSASQLTPTPIDPNQCVTGSAVNNGNIIPGQYIVAYNSGEVGRRSGVASLMATSAEILERNDIPETKISTVFAGEPGGFVAKLTDDEVTRLNADPAIKNVEPDRIVSLGGCFTVAEPRLITWNVNRIGYGDGRGKTA